MPRAALAAWARIAPGSPIAASAAQSRDELLRQFHDSGRFAALEELLDGARRGTGPVAAELGQALARLWRYEGRFDEVRRLLRVEWARALDPVRTLRDLWMLDAEPVPLEMVRGVLDEAAGRAPDDDRVWLGRANLATWSGRFEEADRWLARCLERRPRDPAVWRARLDWARAVRRVDVGRTGPREPAGRWGGPGRGPGTPRLVSRRTRRPPRGAPRPGAGCRAGTRQCPGPGAARDPGV